VPLANENVRVIEVVTHAGRVERMPENPEQELAPSGGLEPEVADDEA
jgi:hypothetical protein